MGTIHQQLADLSPERRKLLEILLQREAQQIQPSRAGIPRRPDPALAPLSFAQQRMWLLDQIEPGNPLYTLPTAMRVSGPLDLRALRHSLNALVARHAALRTTFALRQGQPAQQIAAPRRLQLPLLDLQALADDLRAAAVQRRLAAAADHAFDLARGPLLHTLVLRLAPADHVLIVSMHHIIADGWAIGVFVRELLDMYAARVRGAPDPLRDPPLQYADFAHWQRERITGAFLEGHLAYWRRQLAGAPTLQLPTDHPRPARHIYRSAHLPFSLSPDLTHALQALSQSAGSTLHMALLAGFSALMARLSGQNDFCVGTVVANRTHPDLEGAIGFFVNNLALRMDLRGDPRMRALLDRAREVTLEAYEHQDAPFEHVIAALQLDRAERYSPLFQVMCVVQNYPRPQTDLPDLRLRPLRTAARRSGFDLTLWMWEEGRQLIGELEFNPLLFAADTVRRIGNQLRTLLASMVADPDQRLSRVGMLPAAERRAVLEDWSGSAVAYSPRCVHALVEDQAERTPDAIAVVVPAAGAGGSEQRLTYRELNRRANQLAHHLRALGLRTGDRAGICVERSAELIVGLLGILKAGAAYVPLDPAYPQDRLAFMIESAQASALVTRQRLVERLPAQGARVVRLDADAHAIAQARAGNPDVGATADQLLYVIYTSGSTGRPKGAGVYHRGFVNLLSWYVGEFAIDSRDRALLITSLSFDLTQKNIFAPLIAGGALHLYTSEYYDIDAIARIISGGAVTLLNCTPSAFYPLIEQADRRTYARIASLRYVFLGGEPIAVARLNDWLASPACAATVVNSYGPTECTDVVAFYRIDDPDRLPETSVPIGKPIYNTKLYILDQDLQLLPVGAIGELCVAGHGVGAGYLNDSARTALKFAPHPFAQEPEARSQKPEDKRSTINDDSGPSSFVLHPSSNGGRLYRTGDLARYLAGGAIEFLGRIDDQIKLRGFRIELGEVESVLGQHPAVEDCAVVVRNDSHGDSRLVAYVVTSQGSAVGDQGPGGAASGDLNPDRRPLIPLLRDWLRERLPDYMIPSAFVLLGALPLTPSGKVDRRALPALDAAQAAPEAGFVAPRTPVEAALADLWADVLRVERVGVEDNFFALGGHSLLITQIFSRLQATFEVDPPLRMLFEHPTVAGLARQIEALQRETPGVRPPPLRPLRREDPQPLSFAQQRLWFLDQLQPGSPAYNIPAAVQVGGALDPAALQICLGAIVQRHEALRTTFAMRNQQPVQLIAPALRTSLALVDLQGLPKAARSIAARRLAGVHAQQPFDLARGPLIRAALLRLGPAEHILLLNMHHIISDGWSIGVLIDEIAALYPALRAGRPDPLPNLPIQYADYAIWQRQWLQGPALDAQLGYWTRQLAGAPALLDLPLDRPRSTSPDPHGALVVFTLPPALRDALAALSQAEGATLFMTLLATLQALFARYSGQTDLVIGSPIAGRTRPELERLIGFFVNTLALRGDLSGDPAVRAAIGRVRAACLDAYAHQDLPFELLVEALQPARDLSYAPLAQVMFALQNAPISLAVSGLTLTPIATATATARFDLGISFAETPQGLVGRCEYRADLFDAPTIRRLVGHFRRLLEAVAADPDRRMADLPLLTGAERQQLLVEWNDAAEVRNLASGVSSQEAPIHELLAAQATRSPDSVALVFGMLPSGGAWGQGAARPPSRSPYSEGGCVTHLTYGALDRRANQLAHHLRALGAGTEARVAISLPRSIELVIGLVGILKSGSAFVPLDPSHPDERIRFMIEDSGATVLVTQGERRRANDAGRTTAIVDLRDDWPLIARSPAHSPAVGAHGANLAYLIYTSGSTGRPKAVLAEHRNLTHTLLAAQRQFGFSAQERMPWIASAAFDIALFELFSPLLAGGSALVLTSDQALDLPRLLTTLESCTALHCVPSLMRQIADAARGRDPRRFAWLRRVFVGGDSVPPALLADLRRAFRFAVVRVLYGPTEATIISTRYRAPNDPPRDRRVIGSALPAVQAWITDAAGRPMPIGAPGEIRLAGPGVTRGYLGQPDLTAARFIPNPFAQGSGVRGPGSDPELRSPIPDPRLYRTGDLARWRADGTIEFLGRVDGQVKLRGFRIELGEIESALSRHSAVRACAVALREDAPGDPRIVAYLVTSDELSVTSDEQISPGDRDSPLVTRHSSRGADSSVATRHSSLASELRDWLSARLPGYMVPSAFVALDALPLTRNGKVDRRALPAPASARDELGDAGFVAPRTPIEEDLARIWAELLRADRVGVHDNFFALGGHSLLATQIIARAREELKIELPLRSLFEHPTVAGLAGRVEAAWRETAEALPPLRPSPRDRPLPLSFAQQRLWFLDQLSRDGAGYTIPAAVRLAGPLDLAALRRSLNAIVQRHEALRTTFAIVGERPIQVIAPTLRVPLALADLRALPDPQRADQAERLAANLSALPFDLARGPLIRAALVRVGADEHIALLTMHHIVSDGWSVGVFIAELADLYAAFAQGRPASLPDLPIQYADYAIWQRDWLDGPALDAQIAYWRRNLEDLPLVQIPTDHPRPPRASQQGAHIAFTLPQDLSDALDALSRRAGATIFMTGLAAWCALLARYSGQNDLVVGTPIAGRRHKATEALIGFFVNMLALRTDLAGDPTFSNLLRRTREVALGAYAHQDAPFEEVVEAVQPTRDLSRHPIFQVAFSLQSEQLSALSLPGLTLAQLPVEYAAVKFDLSLILIERSGALRGVLQYRADLFEPDTIGRLAGHFQALLRGIVDQPDRPVGAIPILAEAEVRQIARWSAGPAQARPNRCVHELFAGQAALTPDAVALTMTKDAGRTAGVQGSGIRDQYDLTPVSHPWSLTSEPWHLSYSALDWQSSRLARRLRALGAGPEARVALFMERSIELVIGLLGIFKSGSAFVPLDPAYPPDRLAFMLADADPALLLTRPYLRERLPAHAAPVVVLDDAGLDAAPPGGPATDRSAQPDNLAYLIYTSGSTGRPKGVQIEHRSLSATLDVCLAMFQPGDVMPWMASAAFDIALFELLTPLLAGGTVVVLAQPQILDLEGLRATLERCTVVHATPSLMRQIAHTIRAGAPSRPAPARLRRIFVGGDRVPAELAQDLRALFPAAAIAVLYGPTEAAIISAGYAAPHDAPIRGHPIGAPLPNVQIWLLDRRRRQVPIGVAGEIHIGGAGIARGYRNRPDLTAAAFAPNPFVTESGVSGQESDPDPRFPIPDSRLYRTGDLARYRSDGTLEFLGRVDAQVKVRGFRIELGEVESVLEQRPDVRECVVVTQADGIGDLRLVAYIVQGSGVRGQGPDPEPRSPIPDPRSLIPAELRGWLAARLPDYMIPAAFVFLDALPLTPNGKIDRRALPAPNQERPDPSQGFVAPRTPLEQRLANLWRDLLELDAVGVHDNFFELGGNSIQAALLANKLQTLLGEVFYVVAVFDAPTIAKLAAVLAERYPAALARLLDAAPSSAPAAAPYAPIGAAQVAALRRAILPLADYPAPDAPNPPALFVLSPPRSGSTLLRVLLAGHPRLFAPPELELLSFNTLAARRAAFAGRNRFWLEGALRAVMEVTGGDAEAAERLMADYERQNLPVHAFYRRLQGWLGERTLVDKTPAYALDPAILARMERDFAQPKYIRLLRHPYGMIRSFEEARIDQVFFRHPHSFTPRALAELIWLVSHQNITAFLRTIPPERQHVVRFEDLVTRPRAALEGVCAFLGLDVQPAMLDPYQDQRQRMTDGVHAHSRMVGDVKFLTHQGIDAAAGERWKRQPAGDPLGEQTWQVAEALGYQREPDLPDQTRRPVARSPLVALQQRGARTPLFLVHPAGGEPLCYYDLARRLGDDQPVYGLRAIGLDDATEPAADIPTMARQYAGALRDAQPDGPYLLGGWSLGGVIAFELARQLRAQGQEIGLLAMFDPPPPRLEAAQLAEDDMALLAGFAQHLGLNVDQSATDLEELRRLDHDARLRRLLDQAQAARILPRDADLAHIRRRLDIFRLHGRALRDYRPERYDGRITLFRAAERFADERRDPAREWGALAACGVDLTIVPGDHYAILRPPHVRALAERLRAALDELAAAHAPRAY